MIVAPGPLLRALMTNAGFGSALPDAKCNGRCGRHFVSLSCPKHGSPR